MGFQRLQRTLDFVCGHVSFEDVSANLILCETGGRGRSALLKFSPDPIGDVVSAAFARNEPSRVEAKPPQCESAL
jgi:hypothetical protein